MRTGLMRCAVFGVLAVVALVASSTWSSAAPDHIWSDSFNDPATSGNDPQAITSDANGNVIIGGMFEGTIDFGGGPIVAANGSDMYVAAFDTTGNHLWSKNFAINGVRRLRAIEADSAGNVVVAGWFNNTADFGGGPLVNTNGFSYDGFLAKFDSGGNHVWSRSYDFGSTQEVRSIAIDESVTASSSLETTPARPILAAACSLHPASMSTSQRSMPLERTSGASVSVTLPTKKAPTLQSIPLETSL